MSDETWSVVRSQTMKATPEAVQAQLVDFHKWKSWSPWEELDPDLQRTYTGPESGVGASYAWSGNRKAGAGSMKLTGVQPDRVDIDLSFLKPFKSQSKVTFGLAPSDDDTTVTWTMSGEKTFMTRVMGLFTSMDKVVGKDFEKGLARLKTTVEG